MTTDPDCVFCKIVAGEIKSDIVAEDERTVAFNDLAPAAPTHVLVVPRRHITSAATVTADDGPILAELIATAQQVASQEGIADSGYRLVMNVGDDALNSVPHLHVHVLGGKRLGWPPG